MTKPKKAADLAREIWRLGVGRCEARGLNDWPCGKQLQGAHWFGVGSNIRISSDLRNGFSLCSVCHRRFHDDSGAFEKFINGHPLKKHEAVLRRLKRPGGPKIDWDDRIDFLKEIRRAIKAGEMTLERAREYEPLS